MRKEVPKIFKKRQVSKVYNGNGGLEKYKVSSKYAVIQTDNFIEFIEANAAVAKLKQLRIQKNEETIEDAKSEEKYIRQLKALICQC